MITNIRYYFGNYEPKLKEVLNKYDYCALYNEVFNPERLIYYFCIYFGQFCINLKKKEIYDLRCYEGYYSDKNLKCLKELSSILLTKI